MKDGSDSAAFSKGRTGYGGYGYIMEYPVAQAYLAARLLTIFGGTNEIMRDVVGRTIAG